MLNAVTQEKQAQADQLRAIVSLAQNYTAATDSVINDELLDELVEQTTPGGSPGTAPISEFAAMELGPLMGCSPARAKTIMFETLNLYHRHPSLWDAVQDLSLDAHRARKAAGKFGILDPETADTVGRAWVTKQHRFSWQGAIDLCDTLIIAADPAIAAAREARQLQDRNVRLWEPYEATVNLTAKLDLLDAKYVNATITQLAGILHAKPEYSRDAADVLRSKALGIMAHPAIALAMLQAALQPHTFGTTQYETASYRSEGGLDEAPVGEGLPIDPETGRVASDPAHCTGHTCGTITINPARLQPRVQIYIHLHPDATAVIENTATIAVATLRELLDGKQIRVTPVLDLNTIPPEHQYRPSRRLREAACLLFPTEAFPYSNRTSRGLDLDHTTAYQQSCRDPQTRLGNLGPFSRRLHRGKTAGFWTCMQPCIGQLVWTSPLGFRYTLDNNGTRRIH
ncbi:hypothetical protein EAX62_07845 [Tessaracoccus antarcticus]|uniref:DUF222 domain-containing protein n=1 Tax=Tessaracoccus antarcticus TaxID=2479848 RepID=A0A3M0G6C2_9ACTN|nr:hypothetical protein EAX62_07845 [Tessaracoccus antarcticus]